MAGEKRKRRHEESLEIPRKKIAVDRPPANIQVSVVEESDDWAPLIASSPGLVLPQNLLLKPYTKASHNSSQSAPARPEILLHSSTHPKLDYTAREECSDGSDSHLRHYIGVYDPATGKLQLVQARKAVVRSTLRSADTADPGGHDGTQDGETKLSARSNLGLAFGTKKSQKAIRALTANAIQPSPSKAANQGSPDKRSQLDPVASAVISSMAETTSSMPTREEMQAEIDEAKPRPKPNMQASTPAEVYPIEQLVGGANVLAAMGVKEWIEKVKAREDVQLKSRYVARKLAATVQSGDVKKLKTMRYLLLLVEWFAALKPSSKVGKRVPKLEEMEDLFAAYGREIVTGVARRFADGFILNKWHVDNVITHILAIAVTLDNFVLDTNDIREDLKLEHKDVSKYFAELGCVLARPSDAERGVLDIMKAEAQNHSIARLKLPLSFPKTRMGTAKKRR